MTKINKPELSFTPEQTQLIKNVMAVGATDDELKLFLYQAKRTGLDPLNRQIYFIQRRVWDKEKKAWSTKPTIQTSIDGFRVIAERSGNYAGQSAPEFEEGEKYPKKCTIKVYRFSPNGDRYEASVGVAYWDEYVQMIDEYSNGHKTGNRIVGSMWSKMPHTMIAKVAEALALRKAFPQDLSGLYAGEEMEQPEQGKIEEPKKKLPLVKTKRIHAILNELGASHDQSKEFLKSKFNVDSHNDLTEKQADDYIKALEERKQKRPIMNEVVDPDEALSEIDDLNGMPN